MRARTYLIVALVAIATMAFGAAAAGAQGQTFRPGEFTVDMPMPGESSGGSGGKAPDCKPAIETVALSGGKAECALNNTITGDKANGTVANATLAGDYGTAFNNGTMTRTCDMVQKMSMEITFAAGALTGGQQPTMKMNNGEMTVSCSWKMTFPDDKSSSLSGSMDVSAKLKSQDVQSSGVTAADIDMTLKVTVTEGTGIFEGYVGSGEMDATQGISLLGGGGGAPGGEGGSIPTPPGGGSTTPPTSGGGQIPDAACQAAGLPAGCTPQQYCQANPSACQGSSPRRSGPAARQSGGDSMNLVLVKSAGSVRIISPLPTAGTKAAKVSNKTRVKIVATKGAVCTVKASTKKTVGKVTSRDSSVALSIKAKKGSLAKAKWIQASCTLGGKKFSSAKVKVKG